jgi:hypothetical protein
MSLNKKANTRYEQSVDLDEDDEAMFEDFKPQKEKRMTLQDINKVLSVDTRIINFNNYLPGKLLGSNLLVANKTDCEQIIELSVDQESYMYQKNALVNMFPETAKA